MQKNFSSAMSKMDVRWLLILRLSSLIHTAGDHLYEDTIICNVVLNGELITYID